MLCSIVVGRSIPFGPGSTLRSMVIFDCAQVFYRGAMRLHRSDILLDARLLAYRRGGISRYVEALVHWLPRVAPDLDVRPFINRQTQLDTTPVRVLTPPHHRFERSVLGIELSARFPRLVHSPDFITPRVLGLRQVVTVHDLNFINHPEQLTPDSLRYYRQLKSSLRSVDRIIAVSSYTAGQLETVLHIDPSRIDVIPNGVEIFGSRTVSDQSRRSGKHHIGRRTDQRNRPGTANHPDGRYNRAAQATCTVAASARRHAARTNAEGRRPGYRGTTRLEVRRNCE